jgi:hypothetical protein
MTAADMGTDRADVAERVRAAAFEDEDGRRIVHSFLGGLGADWDEDDVLAFIADERNVIGWVENILGHDLRVVEPVSGRRPRVYYFDVTRPPQPVVPEQAATEVDTSLEVALDGVLSRYGLPSYGYPHGGDRGDWRATWRPSCASGSAWRSRFEGVINDGPEIRPGLGGWRPVSTLRGFDVRIKCDGEVALEFYASVAGAHQDGREHVMTMYTEASKRLGARLEVVTRG